MLQISDNAAALIKKMTARHGIPDGGLRIGIKAGGCSGLSYTFAWERQPRLGVGPRVRQRKRLPRLGVIEQDDHFVQPAMADVA